MMDFEERRSEIFRRSDERIKARKRNRKRILLSCVPIVLCLGILTAALAQGNFTEKADSMPNTWGMSADEATVQKTEGSAYGTPAENPDKGIPSENAICFGEISLNLPEGWEYDTFEGDDTFSPDETAECYGINIRPAGSNGGKISIEFCPYFAVCGTGLSEKKITVGNYDALMGIYNDEVWTFITLIGEPQHDYVILNDGAEEWWSDHGDEAMAILDTLTVGSNISDTDH